MDNPCGSESLVSKASGFVQESVEELKKVSTPTRQETIQATIVTVLIILFVAISLFLLDLIFNRLISLFVMS